MKKFCLKLFLACIPFIIYLVLFILYEPYNYFGLKEKADEWTRPLARVREFMRHPSGNIIIGDSRMNHFDLDYLEELTGRRYVNLSTGGQSLNLGRQMYDFASERVEIENLLMDVSFYQLREGNRSPSAEPVFYIAQHPMEYLVTRDYAVEAFSNMMKKWGISKEKEAADEPYEEELSAILAENKKYREDLVVYAMRHIYPECKEYRWGQEEMGFAVGMIQDTLAGGGEVKVLLPAVQESIWEYVIEPLELADQMAAYRQELSRYTDLYDMEWKSELSERQDYFADGFHFKTTELYQIYARNVFGEADESVRVKRCSNIQ